MTNISTDLSVFTILGNLKTNYLLKTTQKIKILDSFIFFLLLNAITIFCYAGFVGTFPFNSFLAAFFTSIGLIVLTGIHHLLKVVSLRKQVNEVTAVDFVDTSLEKAYGGYVLCSLVLFFVATIFMG